MNERLHYSKTDCSLVTHTCSSHCPIYSTLLTTSYAAKAGTANARRRRWLGKSSSPTGKKKLSPTLFLSSSSCLSAPPCSPEVPICIPHENYSCPSINLGTTIPGNKGHHPNRTNCRVNRSRELRATQNLY
ncbi:unnamed protein product, partial [Ectocarpus sp. 8 AP-2014]